jgi:HrpA-like RNA helicase
MQIMFKNRGKTGKPLTVHLLTPAQVKQVSRLHAGMQPPGDVLVFVTGQEDVQATCELLAENLDTIRETDVEVRSRNRVHERRT